MRNTIPSPDGKWKARRRAGQPAVSWLQMQVLVTLRDAKKEGFDFVPIQADKRTIRSLMDRDWILSFDLQDSRYRITGRGLKALSIYERPTRRFDKMCPDCGEPRAQTRNGTLKPYCDECNKRRNNMDYHLKGHQYRPETPCSKCKKRPRHTYPSGFMIAYCQPCRKKMRRQEKKRKTKRLLAMIHRGEPVLCRCGKPRYHTANTVYDYCHEHYREQQNRYLREHSRPSRKGESPNAPSNSTPRKGVR